MYFDPVPVIIGFYALMMLTALLVFAHLGWLAGLWQRLCPFGFEWPRAGLFVLAALTPVLSFYIARLLDRWRGVAPQTAPTEPWRLLIPALSVVLLALITAQAQGRINPAARSMDHAIQVFALLMAYALPAALILHMAATVFGVTRRPFLTSQTLLLVPGLMALLALT